MGIKLPKNWVETQLGKVFSIVTGNTPSKKILEYYGNEIPWVKPADINRNTILFDSDDYLSKLGSTKARMLPKGAVMVTCIGNLGYVAMAGTECATNQQINSIVDISGKFNTKYIYYFSFGLKPWLIENSTSTTISMVNKTVFSKAPFYFPSRPEQDRIVAKLDILMSKVETMQKSMERIPQLLKDFRQQVLTQAVTGKLTEKWRGKETKKILSPITIDEITEETNEDWRWVNLNEIAKLESGHTPRKSVIEYWENGDVPWICLQDIRAAHGKVINDTKFKPTVLGLANSSARLLPKGTVCFSRDISVGFTTIMGKEMATTQHFANWICGVELNNRYLLYAFMQSSNYLIHKGKGTTVKTLYYKDLAKLMFYAPPIKEQLQIVSIVKNLLGTVDAIEEKYKTLKIKIDTLPQAILHKAFKGELVEQLPTDADSKNLLREIEGLKKIK